MKYIIILGLTFFTLGACQNNSDKKVFDEKIKSLEKEVLAIHDEVMPRMGEVVQLSYKIDSLVKVTVDTARQNVLSQRYNNLVKADKDMMHWMRGYATPALPYDSSSLKYLLNEKEKVEKLKVLILTSIDEGKAILNNN
ncbi:MAG: viral A-type inclusion protein [Bacteroidia bacterium]|nr:viral A-type inclusion protein [Bacteroidia bacterium]MBP9690088.1 viral A-type inclusion protein [Bacteroidia bacterium]